MTPAADPGRDLTDLGSLWRLLRQCARRAVVLGILGCAAGIAVVASTPASYQSTAVLLVSGAPGFLAPDVSTEPDDGGKGPRLRTLDTEAQLLRSGPLLDRVVERLEVERRSGAADLGRLGELNRDRLTEHIRISAPSNTRVLNISFTAPTGRAARRGAQVVAEEYVAARRRLLDDRAKRVADALWTRRNALRQQITDLERGVEDTANDSPLRAAAMAQRAHLAEQIRGLDRGLAEVADTRTASTEVVRAAPLPGAPMQRNLQVPPLSGLLGGALTGLIWGYLRERKFPKVRAVEQVQELVGLPVLARLGTRERLRGLSTEIRLADAQRVLVTGVAHPSMTSAVGKLLRTAMAYVDEPCEVKVVTDSPTSATTLRLAHAVDLVLLVAEVRRSSLTELRDVARLLSRANTPAAVVLTPPTRRWRRRRR